MIKFIFNDHQKVSNKKRGAAGDCRPADRARPLLTVTAYKFNKVNQGHRVDILLADTHVKTNVEKMKPLLRCRSFLITQHVPQPQSLTP